MVIALAGCGRIGFDSAGSDAPGGSSGDGAIAANPCTTVVFADSFDGTTTGGSWFPLFAGGSGGCSIGATVQNGEVDMMFQAASGPGCAGGLIENPTVDLHGACAVFEIAAVPASASDRGIVAVGSQSDFVGFRIEVNVSAVSRTSAMDTELASVPFDPVLHRFLLVGQTGSSFVLGAAPSAAGPFTRLATAPTGTVPLSAGAVLFEETVTSGTSVVGDTFAVASVSLAR